MTEKLDEQVRDEAEFRRVSMLWPADVKEQVRRLVGGRGLTTFTLDAVQEKLARLHDDPAADDTAADEPAGAPAEPEPEAHPGRCPRCLDQLVNGECWTCP